MTPEQTIAALADEMLSELLGGTPVGATLLGFHEWDDRLPDFSEAGQDARGRRLTELAARAAAVDPAALGGTDRVTRAVLREMAQGECDQLAARAVEYTVTDTFIAPAVELLVFLPMTELAEPAHADGYLERLKGMPGLLDTIGERHRAGLAAGRTPVRGLVAAAVAHLDQYLSDPGRDPLARPDLPADLPSRDAFAAERDRLLAEAVRPAYARYRELLESAIAPHARAEERPGLNWLPDGEAMYAGLVRAHTTTDRTPSDLHALGEELIEQLAGEYARIGERALGVADPAEVRRRLRDDPALRWPDGDALLAHAKESIRRAEAAAPDWFGTVPEQRCAVVPVPESDAPGAPAAYYVSPALDGSRPGTYFANTHDAAQRGRAGYEAVAFHEAVPGHHFQIARAQELGELPMLRRVNGFNAYSEGWGLYAERLADEMGLYSDDIARLGRLSEDSMRAARLVVDTGLHARGWSRDRAVEYLRAHTATPEVEIQSEVDRYIAMPGQALAYMVGRLEIERARAAAERALGDRFDVRAFHDTVLGSGGVPLTVLAELVEEWAAAQR
ncbi:DUF885 domain-containing protein [Glycomyces sp. A-F 0318]|uniref:DUF885 domain-containing protein n=1 Tax=Glycomyces amatae TaxID=2881355 RepID=UPI001E34FBDA|nr:DUF885 domain-containing protein [Glycomyces amatae]MCD0445373.1 DUF885 domain-containing protein [Glycomyces amatae]